MDKIIKGKNDSLAMKHQVLPKCNHSIGMCCYSADGKCSWNGSCGCKSI